MEFYAAGLGLDVDRYPEWARQVQAQLRALHAGPRKRWRRFRRCELVRRECGCLVGEVMDTSPPVLLSRFWQTSGVHPLAGDENSISDHDLAARLFRLDRTRYGWTALDRLASAGESFGEVLVCDHATIRFTREDLVHWIDGTAKVTI